MWSVNPSRAENSALWSAAAHRSQGPADGPDLSRAVVAKTLSLDLGPLSLGMASDVLDDASADKLRAIEGVREVLAAADQRRTR